jgi:hypothetical protein
MTGNERMRIRISGGIVARWRAMVDVSVEDVSVVDGQQYALGSLTSV